jgi:hypothetical protein
MVRFGGCTFSGDTNGAPLARAGVCPEAVGQLDLSDKSINSLPESVFAGMENLQ